MGSELRDSDGRGRTFPEGRLITEAELPSYFWEQFPIFLSYGMTASEYWDGDNRLPRAYLKAQKLKEERENRYEHRLGAYIYQALCDVSPLFRFTMKKGNIKPEPYLKEPFPLTEEEAEDREEKARRIRRERFFAQLQSDTEKEN